MHSTRFQSASKPLLAALGLITGMLLLLSVEGILALLDVPQDGASRDPFVGFSSQENLFTESVLVKKGRSVPMMITNRDKLELFPNESFRKNKAANTLRAFCLGGSTTYGRPYSPRTSFCSWLEDFLNHVDSGHRWEVINAGGVSYASYRIALLMQELVGYEPDLVIVYTGHNEFLERRTYSKILRLPMALRNAGARVTQLRIYALLERLIHPETDEEVKLGRGHGLAEEVLPILDHSVGPEDYFRDDEQKKDIIAHFHYNLRKLIKLARSAHSKVILVAPASKLRHESPFKSQHRSGLAQEESVQWMDEYQSALEAAREHRFGAALSHVSKAENLDPRFAHTFALKGDILYGLERYNKAKQAYRRAVDEDVCPLRAITPLHDSVMEIGDEMNVPVIDFDAVMSEKSPHGITDEKMFLDHVHPTIEGHKILGLELVKKIARSGLVASPRPLVKARIRRIQDAKMSRVDRQAHADALIHRAMLANWGGKFREAIMLAERARETDPEYIDAYYWFKWVRSYEVEVAMGDADHATDRKREIKIDRLLARQEEVEANAYFGEPEMRLEIVGRYDVEKPPPERIDREGE